MNLRISEYPSTEGVIARISIPQLKCLLTHLAAETNACHFRYRLMGEMWQSLFLGVVQVTPSGVLLYDERSEKYLLLRDLTKIMQFEIDSSLSSFHPYCHYDVVALPLYGEPD